MIKKRLPLLLFLCLLLSACSSGGGEVPDTGDEAAISLVATTYPIYLLASELTKEVDGITVTAMINQDLSCLHNYTLTTSDMKLLEGADVILMNGAGLDDFILTAALSNPDVVIVECHTDIPALYYDHDHDHGDHEDHDHEDGQYEVDPHYWMDPDRVILMLEAITEGLSAVDPEHQSQYVAAGEEAATQLQDAKAEMTVRLNALKTRDLITFHDGFGYFAAAFDLHILMAIEEEEGQEASARVIAEALGLIDTYSLPAIFTEVNSSDATAQAIARESGVSIHPLTMIMSGETKDAGIHVYIEAMNENVDRILEALS